MTVATAAAVEIDGLTISYRRRGQALRVISDLSLTIRPGEAYGLVGESGCGKTTVAMAVMRYLPQNAVIESGAIRFAGDDLLGASPETLRRWRGNRMAMVYQDPGTALNPSIRVGHQIAEVYELHRGMKRREAMDAAGAMLETVQISDPARVLRRYPHELSGGQQQRVMFAMALATEPELLVLDEPTTGLDATVEAEVLDLVEQLREGFDAAILFVSHNLGVVSRVCERVGVLYAGPAGRAGPCPRALHRSPPPIHAGAPALRAAARDEQGRRPARSDPWVAPASRGRDRGLRLRRPLPLAPRRLPRGSAAARAGGRPPPGGLPLPGRGPGDPARRCDGLRGDVRAGRCAARRRPPGQGVQARGDGADRRRRRRLELRVGEVLGLVGESGSGKTSLARCIAGLVEPTEGSVRFDGQDVTVRAERRSREVRRRLQMVFQNPDNALNPRHTVRAILRRSLQLLAGVSGRDRQEKEMLELARSVRLEPRALDVRPAALSAG